MEYEGYRCGKYYKAMRVRECPYQRHTLKKFSKLLSHIEEDSLYLLGENIGFKTKGSVNQEVFDALDGILEYLSSVTADSPDYGEVLKEG